MSFARVGLGFARWKAFAKISLDRQFEKQGHNVPKLLKQ